MIGADSLNKLLEVVKKMHEAVLSDEIKRVVMSIKIDDRKDKNATIDDKIKSVKEKLE